MGIVNKLFSWSNLTKGVKTTPIRFFGFNMYMNARAKVMAKRADKINNKKYSQGIDTLFAQIANDAKLGMYYGIYTLRIENLSEALTKLRRRDYAIIQIGSDTDYIYLALYWGHWTGLKNSRAFARSFARYVSETALYAGKRGIYVDTKTLNKFTTNFKKKLKEVSDDEYGSNKELFGKDNPQGKAICSTCQSLVLQTVTAFISLLKGGQPLYVPDQACCDGLIKLSEGDTSATGKAISALSNLRKVLEALNIWKFFASIYKRYNDTGLYDKCLSMAAEIEKDANDSKKAMLHSQALQIYNEMRYLTPEEAKIRTQLMKERHKI